MGLLPQLPPCRHRVLDTPYWGQQTRLFSSHTTLNPSYSLLWVLSPLPPRFFGHFPILVILFKELPQAMRAALLTGKITRSAWEFMPLPVALRQGPIVGGVWNPTSFSASWEKNLGGDLHSWAPHRIRLRLRFAWSHILPGWLLSLPWAASPITLHNSSGGTFSVNPCPWILISGSTTGESDLAPPQQPQATCT